MKQGAVLLYRFLVPVVLLAAAAWLLNNNQTADEVIAFSFVDDLVPSTRGDPQAMGRFSVWILVGLAAASAAWNGWGEVQRRRLVKRLGKRS